MAIGNALMGVSFGWWVAKHNAHHAFPNHIGRDPDLDVTLVPQELIDDAPRTARRTPKALTSWRAWTFFPLMLLRSTGLHVLGLQRLLRNRNREAALEGVLIALHFACYLTIVFWVLSPVKALAFIAVQQGVFSVYLGCSFAPNHKGMAVFRGDAVMSFARRQVTTARNVRGGRFTSFALGGLNYQIEHHLFPSMPRPNLARAQHVIRSFCIESGLGYREETFLGSFVQTLRTLSSIPAPARAQGALG
jgi:fatty acid desaturase